MSTGEEPICFNNVTTILIEIADMLSIIIADNRQYRNDMLIADYGNTRPTYIDTRDETLFSIYVSKFIDKVRRYELLIDSILSNRENPSNPLSTTWYSLEVISCQLYQLLSFYMGEVEESYMFDMTSLSAPYNGVIGYERQIIDIMTFFLVDMMEEVSYLIDAMIQNQSHVKNTLVPALNFKTIDGLSTSDYFISLENIIQMIAKTLSLTNRNDITFIKEIYKMMTLAYNIYPDRTSLRRYNVIKRFFMGMNPEEIRRFLLRKNDPRNILFFDYVGPLGKLDILDYIIRMNDPTIDYIISNDYYDNSLLVLYYTDGLSEHILPLEYLAIEEQDSIKKAYIESMRDEIQGHKVLAEKIKNIIRRIQLDQWTCIC